MHNIDKKILAGFTYIEAMIIITVLVMLSTMAFAVYSQFRGRQELKSEVSRLVESFEAAKKKASADKKPCDTYSGRYAILWTTTGYSVAPGGCTTESTYTLPSTITIDADGTGYYKSTGFGPSAQCLLLQDSQTNQCRKITIDEGGAVNEQIESDCACP